MTYSITILTRIWNNLIILFYLKQHGVGFLHVVLEGNHPFGADCSVNHSMVATHCHFHNAGHSEVTRRGLGDSWVLLVEHQCLFRLSDCENARLELGKEYLRGIDDSTEMLDSEIAQI